MGRAKQHSRRRGMLGVNMTDTTVSPQRPVTADLYRNRALVLALALLLVPAANDDAVWRSMFFFAHIGAVLLWQPVVPQKHPLSFLQMALIAITGALLSAFLSAWVLLAWSALLTGLTAGKITMLAPREERGFYLGALGFLVVLLFLLIVPGLLPAHLQRGLPGAGARYWLSAGLAAALVPLALLAWRSDRAASGQRDIRRELGAAYDLVYTVWVVGMLLLVIFFGIALMALARLGYLESMALTLIGVSALLLLFSWVSMRFQDSDGTGGANSGVLPAVLSRYLLSFGLPYEVWLDKLTALHRQESDPAQFFDNAMRGLGSLAIVAGAEWRGPGIGGRFGRSEGGDVVRIDIQEHTGETGREIEVLLRTREVLSPAFLWHFKLLIGLAAEFYWAKVREAALVQRNYLRAVHETGARLTHDVKNLLQSLNGLIEAVNYVEGDEEIRKLIGRQLPAIALRLAATVEKLQAPSTNSQRMTRLDAWWDALCKRYERDGVQFQVVALESGLPISDSLFDSAAENLISNALRKRAVQPQLRVTVMLACRGSTIELAVEDDGDEIDALIAGRLFTTPLASRDGLGIGLYQLASRAGELGYRLFVAENRDGCVRFALTNAPQEEVKAGVQEKADEKAQGGRAAADCNRADRKPAPAADAV